VTLQIVSSRLCPRCKGEMSAEPASSVVLPPIPVSDGGEAEKRMDGRLNGNATASKSNVVALKQARSIHEGPYSCARTDVSRDPMMGGFSEPRK
jgi:hypothetical protein